MGLPVKNLVCFAILMENNEGIRGKSEDYILSKYKSCMAHDEPEAMLDLPNKLKYYEWLATWEVKDEQ